jgi:hypothetical protein
MKTYADQPLYLWGPRFVREPWGRPRFPHGCDKEWEWRVRSNNPRRWEHTGNNPEDFEMVQESFMDWYHEIRKNNP